MTSGLTIAEAAQKALNALGRPSSVAEIYAEIVRLGLYSFDTPTPEHVLRTTIRRYSDNVERVDAYNEATFHMAGDEIYMNLTEAPSRSGKPGGAGIKRIHRATDKEETIRALTSEQVGIFREIWKLLLFAALVGVKNDYREPLKSVESGKGIDQSTFGNSPSWPGILHLISLSHTGDSRVLRGSPDTEEQRITLFQEYANGGLSLMQQFFVGRTIDLDGVLAFIESQTASGHVEPNVDLAIKSIFTTSRRDRTDNIPTIPLSRCLRKYSLRTSRSVTSIPSFAALYLTSNVSSSPSGPANVFQSMSIPPSPVLSGGWGIAGFLNE